MRIALVVVALVVALALTGCSFFFVHGPGQPIVSNTGASLPPDCTTSMALPIFDGIIGALGWVGTADAVSKRDTEGSNDRVVSAVLFASVFTASAFVGYTRASRCQESRERFMTTYPYGPGSQQQTPPPYQAQPPGAAQPEPAPAEPAPVQPAPPAPRPPVPSNPLGTEGDVCNAISDCAGGLVCNANVCMKPKP